MSEENNVEMKMERSSAKKGKRVAKRVVFKATPRRSGRKKTPAKHYSPPKHIPRKSRKRRREEDDERIERAKKLNRSEMQSSLSETMASAFQPVFVKNLELTDLDEEKEEKRSKALKTTLKNAVKIAQGGMVYAKANGEFLVTSSTKDETYNVRSVPMADRLHFTCDCGRRFNKGDRVTCKHIFAVVIHSMDSIVRMYYQFSTPESIQGIHDLAGLISKMGIGSGQSSQSGQYNQPNKPGPPASAPPVPKPIYESQQPAEIDYFSSLCSSSSSMKKYN
jgi:hypothetical protein